VLLILAILITVIVNSLNNARMIGFFKLNAGLKEKIHHAASLVEIAKQGNGQPHSLASGCIQDYNGFFYRFNDHIHDAQIINLDETIFDPAQPQDIVYVFNNPEALPMRPSGGSYKVKGGVLVYRHSMDNILTNDTALAINKDGVGDIEIRIKVKRSDELQLCWSASPDAEINDSGKIEQIKFTVIPDGRFHNYRIPGLVMASWLYTRDRTIRKIYLAPMDVQGEDDIEIDFIRFAPRDEKFARRPFGADYEKIDTQMRKILYLHSGYELHYRVIAPSGDLFFQCGITALKDTPVSASVSIESPDGRDILVSGDFSGEKGWRDFNISLSIESDRELSLIFRAEGDEPNVVFFSNPILHSPAVQKRRFIIVMEDSLRADHMSCYGYDRKTTPFKDQWRKEGILFKNAFSQSSFTRSSCTSLLTSLYPSATGVWNNADRLSDNYTTLAEILYHEGFATALFSQNTNLGPFSGLHQGFGTVIDNETIGKRAPGIYAGEELKRWLADHSDRDIFLLLFNLDPHYPFDPPKEVSAPYRDKDYLLGKLGIPHDRLYDPPWLKRPTFESRNFLYDEEIRYNDLYWPALVDTLKNQGIYDNTLLIFTADHGEHMGEHYLWNHQPPDYRRVLHVPMIMVHPKLFPAGLKIRQPMQLIDIMPTLLDIAGISLARPIMQGNSLLPFIRDEILWSELDNRVCLADELRFSLASDSFPNGGIFYRDFHIMTSDRHADLLSHALRQKYEGWYNLFSRTQVFDFKRDPDETGSIVSFLPDFFLTNRIKRFHDSFRKVNIELHEQIAGTESESVVYDDAAIEQFRSLGYIQ
jgi:arylsulfatase A-like enzyme